MRQIAENTKTIKQQGETAIPSLMQNPTPNLLLKLKLLSLVLWVIVLAFLHCRVSY